MNKEHACPICGLEHDCTWKKDVAIQKCARCSDVKHTIFGLCSECLLKVKVSTTRNTEIEFLS